MDDRDDSDVTADKQWASNYILGPLYDLEPSQVFATRFKALPPTPPAPTNPPHRHVSQRHRKAPVDEDDEEQPFLRRLLSRSNSVNTKPLPPSPPRTKYPPLSGLERKRSLHTANPPQTRWNQGTILSRANSVATSQPSTGTMATLANHDRPRRRAGSLAERYPGDRSHRPLETLTQEEHRTRDGEGSATPRRRAGSLRERYPGDMSHRPLAMLAREHRAANRAPHLHNHRRQQPSDTIDSLDASTAMYHHEGPFDATMKARNVNKKLAPVDAVMDTNLEAIKATPAEYLQDSLVKHVPLQGTAVVPPGMRDMSGRTMEYEEGADLMREGDAAGGPYRRWDHVRYRDDDLKGKGEPAFSLEQSRREKERVVRGKQKVTPHGESVTYYEMQPMLSSDPRETGSGSGKQKEDGTQVRQRSVSNADELQPSMAGSSGVQRSNTTGKSLSHSIKRRFGSLRKK